MTPRRRKRKRRRESLTPAGRRASPGRRCPADHACQEHSCPKGKVCGRHGRCILTRGRTWKRVCGDSVPDPCGPSKRIKEQDRATKNLEKSGCVYHSGCAPCQQSMTTRRREVPGSGMCRPLSGPPLVDTEGQRLRNRSSCFLHAVRSPGACQADSPPNLCTKYLKVYIKELQSLLRTHNIRFPTISDHRRTLFDDLPAEDSMCDWEFQSKIGGGAAGSVYTACTPKTYVIKKQSISSEGDANVYFNEIAKLKALQDWKYAPRLLDAWVDGYKGYYAMERLYPCSDIRPISGGEFGDIFHELHHTKKITHNDVHFENVMCTLDGTLKVTDWGEALDEKESRKLGMDHSKPTHSQRITEEEKAIEPMIAYFEVLRLQQELLSGSDTPDQKLVDKINETIRIGRLQLEQLSAPDPGNHSDYVWENDFTLDEIRDLTVPELKEILAY